MFQSLLQVVLEWVFGYLNTLQGIWSTRELSKSTHYSSFITSISALRPEDQVLEVNGDPINGDDIARKLETEAQVPETGSPEEGHKPPGTPRCGMEEPDCSPDSDSYRGSYFQ